MEKGSWVYLTVSAGAETEMVSIPNLVGLSEMTAIEKIEENELCYGGSEYVTSDLPAGTVIGQSEESYNLIAAHTKVILRVSTGPEEG